MSFNQEKKSDLQSFFFWNEIVLELKCFTKFKEFVC